MPYYIALIHKDPDSDYGVSFPDFPGIATAGSTLQEAHAMAGEALTFHIAGMVEDGEVIPEPSNLDRVMCDPVARDGVATLIATRPTARRAVRVNVTLPEDVLSAIDRYAGDHGLTRSGFLAQAARQAIESPID